jgi:hypothetical protein
MHPMVLLGDEPIVARFVLNIPCAQKSFWTHPIELLGDVGHVESRFGLFGDTVSIGCKIGAWFVSNVP